MRSFISELRRRNVDRAAVFYAGASWLLVQVATQVFPFFHIEESVVRAVVVAAAIGFPFALLRKLGKTPEQLAKIQFKMTLPAPERTAAAQP